MPGTRERWPHRLQGQGLGRALAATSAQWASQQPPGPLPKAIESLCIFRGPAYTLQQTVFLSHLDYHICLKLHQDKRERGLSQSCPRNPKKQVTLCHSRCPNLPTELQAGVNLSLSWPISPVPAGPVRSPAPCHRLDLPRMATARGPGSSSPLHIFQPPFPSQPWFPGTQEQAGGQMDRSLLWVLCSIPGP